MYTFKGDISITPSATVFTTIISNITKFDPNNRNQYIIGPTTEVLGRYWAVKLYPAGCPRSSPGMAALCLMFEGPFHDSCTASVTITLVNQSNISVNRIIKDPTQKEFSESSRSCGVFDFIETAKLLDPRYGFLENNTLIIRIEINVKDNQQNNIIRKRKYSFEENSIDRNGDDNWQQLSHNNTSIDLNSSDSSIEPIAHQTAKVHVLIGQVIVATYNVEKSILMSSSDVFNAILISKHHRSKLMNSNGSSSSDMCQVNGSSNNNDRDYAPLVSNTDGVTNDNAIIASNNIDDRDDIFISDFSLEVVNAFLNFLYTKDISDNSLTNIAKELLLMAIQYQVDALQRRCEIYISNYITITNVISILTLADKHDLPLLKHAALKYAKRNRKQVFELITVQSITSISVLQAIVLALA